MVLTAKLVAAAVAFTTLTGAAVPGLPSPGVPPRGANDPSCTGPVVVLIHGTRADMTVNWGYISPRLREDGFCPWALDLPDRGQAPAAESAAAVGRFVREVRRATGARKVSILGHSVGGILGRHHVRFDGGRTRVDDLISMGTPQYGYWSPRPYDEVDAVFNTGCDSCWELKAGSAYLRRLNRGDPTPARVSHTQLITEDDQVATPIDNQRLPEGHGVSNIVIQASCPDHHVDHFMMAADDVVYQWIRHALRTRGPARPAWDVDC
ncbi:MAG: alpha/beta fold hydrolase [Actinobacteria bacterium]|nr:alpha/beta fold hydrolase [Actinomycetota bacterium]